MATIYVSSGVSSDLSLGYSDNVIVLTGGTVYNTLISAGGSRVLVISSGGLADFTSMTEYGTMIVSVNGQADRTTLGEAETSSSGGYVYNSMSLVNSGVINSTTINSNAKVSMYYGATAAYTTVNSGGSFYMFGGTATDTVKNLGGNISNAGGTMNGVTLQGWGGLYATGVSAIVNSAVINSGASIFASSGAMANNTQINSGGTLYIYGGTATTTTVNDGGCLSQGSGVVQGAVVNLGGSFYAGMYWDGSDNGSALNIMENGGAVYVGTYSRYDEPDSVKQYPVYFVSNNFSGLAYSTGSTGTVHSGTTATDISAVYGGLTVYAGGIVNGITVTESTFMSSGYWYDEDDVKHEYSSSVYQNGSIHVMSGGTATGIVGNATGHSWNDPFYFEIAPGTVIEGTINGEKLSSYIGVLENTRTSNVDLAFLSGATVTNLDMYEGTATASSGAKINTIHLRGADLTIAGGAVVNGITTTPVPSSYIEEPFWGAEPEEDPVVIETMKGAAVSVYQGATVTNLDMDDLSYLYLEVAPDTVLHGVSGGQAVDMENASFSDKILGNTYVSAAMSSSYYDSALDSDVQVAGGTVANLVINNGATVVAQYGGMALNMTENGGALNVDDYDMEGITYSVDSNTFSNDHLTGGVTVHKNTVASDCILSNGGLTVFSGGVVSNFYVHQKGMGIADLNIYSGAIVHNADMTRYSFPPFHGGHVEIQEGAYIDGLRLQSDDFVYLNLSSDSVIRNASVDGKPFSFEDGVLSGFRINEGMNSDLNLGEGVTAIVDVWVTDCPIYMNGEGGIHGSNVTLDQSYVYLNEGDCFENLTIGTGEYYTYESDGETHKNYNYASATVYSGATIDGVTVNNGGTLTIGNGGKLTGVMRFGDAQTSVTCSRGSIIDFDLTDNSAAYVARSNDWRFNGRNSSDKPKYTITVDQQQGAGTYVLSNSTYFSDSKDFFLVDGTGTEYGYFSGYFTYEWISDEEYRYYFVSSYSGETIEGLTLTLDAIRIDRDDGVLDFDLVLKVESSYAAPKWIAAPTVTAENVTFTCQDVVLNVTYDDSVVTRQYSSDDGVSWVLFDGEGVFGANGRYQFRGIDADGNYTDVATYTVSNIDKVAPTNPDSAAMTATVDGSSVALAWTDPTDDFSGLKGFNLTYWSDTAAAVTVSTPWHEYEFDELAQGTWHWSVQAVDYAGNVSAAVNGKDFVVGEGPTPPPTPAYYAKSDIDGNGVSDVMFVWAGTPEQPGNYQHGYWMNGTSTWQSANSSHPAEWVNLGCYDMTGDGKADSVLVGNVVVNDVKGAYIGYYADANDLPDGSTWVNIGYLNNADNIDWKNAVGNLTGNASGANSIVWYAPELYALGAWTDGTDSWVTLSNDFGGDAWTLVGCGDFSGDGKESVVMALNGGEQYYAVGIDGASSALSTSDSGWTVRAIGDFSGDGKDDIVAFHKETGLVAMWGDGDAANWSKLGQLDTNDWFVVGAGDYNGDTQDDLLVRQYSTGMLGYYTSGDMAQWNVLGYGVGMEWTVIA